MKNRKAQGFTLIELLIVIAIIGILAAVLIPNLLSARTTAQKRAEQAYVQNVFKASNAYLADNIAATALPTTSCIGSYTAGSYGAGSGPATLTACTVTYTAATQSVSIAATSTIAGVGSFTLP